MAISARHPAVLQLTRKTAALVDPGLPDSSEFSLSSMTRVLSDRKDAVVLAVLGGAVGFVSAGVLRGVAFTAGMNRDLANLIAPFLVVAFVIVGILPFYLLMRKHDKRLLIFANGPHAINIVFLNDSGLNATDATLRAELWSMASNYRLVRETTAELEARGVSTTAQLQERLTTTLDDLNEQVDDAGLRLNTERFR